MKTFNKSTKTTLLIICALEFLSLITLPFYNGWKIPDLIDVHNHLESSESALYKLFIIVPFASAILFCIKNQVSRIFSALLMLLPLVRFIDDFGDASIGGWAVLILGLAAIAISLNYQDEQKNVVENIESFSDEELNKLLENNEAQDPEVIKAYEHELQERLQREFFEEQRLIAAEEKRIRDQKKAAQRQEAKEKFHIIWKKYGITATCAVISIIALAIIFNMTSSSTHMEKATMYFNDSDFEQAIKYLSKIDDKDEEYLEACWMLGQAYYESRNYDESGLAYKKIIDSNQLEDPIFIQTLEYYISGEREPAIKKNLSYAAEIYLQYPDNNSKLKAVSLYYKAKEYEKVYNICTKLPDETEAKAYIGLLNLYGYAHFKPDAYKAWEYMKQTTATTPELSVPHGDMLLYFNELNQETLYLATLCYEIARDADYNYYSNLRVEILQAVNDAIYGNNSGRFSWMEGTYTGETYLNDPNGWGIHRMSNNDLYIGQYYLGQQYGRGLLFQKDSNSYSLAVGIFYNNRFIKGQIHKGDNIITIDNSHLLPKK